MPMPSSLHALLQARNYVQARGPLCVSASLCRHSSVHAAMCSQRPSWTGTAQLHHLEVSTAQEQVNLLSFASLQMLQRAVDFVQLPMTASFHCDLQPTS